MGYGGFGGGGGGDCGCRGTGGAVGWGEGGGLVVRLGDESDVGGGGREFYVLGLEQCEVVVG